HLMGMHVGIDHWEQQNQAVNPQPVQLAQRDTGTMTDAVVSNETNNQALGDESSNPLAGQFANPVLPGGQQIAQNDAPRPQTNGTALPDNTAADPQVAQQTGPATISRKAKPRLVNPKDRPPVKPDADPNDAKPSDEGLAELADPPLLDNRQLT